MKLSSDFAASVIVAGLIVFAYALVTARHRAKWDAERDRRANAILSQYGPMVSGFSDTQFDLDDALTALDQSADLNRNTTLHATRRA